MASLDGTLTITKSEYRPCRVHNENALFHMWEFYSVESKRGIQQCETLGIVELESGKVVSVSPEEIRFMDSKFLFSQYPFENSNGE